MSSRSWMPRQQYNEGEFISYDGYQWRCNNSHISGPEFNKSNFSKFKIGRIPKEREKVSNINYEVITSMNNTYYNKTGRPFLKSFSKHFGHICDVHVYNEGLFEPKAKNMVTEGWDLGPEFVKFQKRWKNDRVKTFAKKGFSIIHAMNTIDCDRLIWMDADTLLVEDFNVQLLDMIAPKDVLSTHFSVWHTVNDITYHSCETGFFILNKNHPGFNEFKDTYTRIYTKDENTDLRRFYDGEVYGKTVELMEKRGHKMLNLNPGKHKTPFSRSVIGPYIQHFKAGLKDRINFDGIEAELAEDEI
jgi:hypothetical protein